MPTPKWLQHPITVFALPLVVLLCVPHMCKLLLARTDPSYDDAKLQRIADLMDNIYTTLANSTFIPHNAIQRGPHRINTTAILCKPSASVLRLMEILPYVDSSLVHEPGWIHGGHFMDYRHKEHIAEACDPLRGNYTGWIDYLTPFDIALTNWGTGGWNNDHTWVMIYNTERDAIRIFDSETWVGRHQAQSEFGEEMHDWWFEDVGENGTWNRAEGASLVLRAIINNYQSLRWTPWKISNREGGFGVPSSDIENLLRRNGWPGAFNSGQFNADFIRAKHIPSGKGYAEAVLKRIDEIAGCNTTRDDISAHDKGEMYWMGLRLRQHEQALETAVNDREQWLHRWRIQRTKWDIDDLTSELKAARAEAANLCPEGVCVQSQDLIHWEYLALKHTREESLFTNYTTLCASRLANRPSSDVSWLDKCTTNKLLQSSWLELAYTQSQIEITTHCERTGCDIPRFNNIFARTKSKITELHQLIANAEKRISRMHSEFEPQIPTHAEEALVEFGRDSALLANGNRFLEEEIYGLEMEMKKLEVGEWDERGTSWLFGYLRDEEQ